MAQGTRKVAKETLGESKGFRLGGGTQTCRIRLRLKWSLLKHSLWVKMLKIRKNIR